MKVAMPGSQQPRGLYIAPWIGDHGGLVLLAKRSDGKLNEPPLEILFGQNSVDIAEQMELRLDRDDPFATSQSLAAVLPFRATRARDIADLRRRHRTAQPELGESPAAASDVVGLPLSRRRRPHSEG